MSIAIAINRCEHCQGDPTVDADDLKRSYRFLCLFDFLNQINSDLDLLSFLPFIKI